MPTVSVIIVNYNAGSKLTRCLAALAEQAYKDFQVIIIDNASVDGSTLTAVQAVAESNLNIRVIDAGSNLGFAAANNRAVETVESPWVAFLNPDAYANPDWLQRLIQATETYPWADAFGSLQVDAHDPTRLDGMGDVMHGLGIAYRGGFRWSADNVQPTGECFAPCAAAALYKREVFQSLGGFDERFFCYGEDVDLGFRLRLAGGRSVQLADATVLHEGSGVTGRISDFTVYHGHRNRIWLTYKNVPGFAYWLLFPFQFLFSLVLLGRSLLNGTAKPYLRAMFDGYRGLGRFTKDRQSTQTGRKVSVWSVLKQMAWSPLAMARRSPKLRPLSSSDENAPR